MTYESALQWGIDHKDIDNYDSFDDWYYALEDAYQTPTLTDKQEFEQMALDYWTANREIEPPVIDSELPPTKNDVVVEDGIVITPSGAKPVIVADTQPTNRNEPTVIIDRSGSTGQRVTRNSFGQSLRNIGQTISSGLYRLFGRGKK